MKIEDLQNMTREQLRELSKPDLLQVSSEVLELARAMSVQIVDALAGLKISPSDPMVSIALTMTLAYVAYGQGRSAEDAAKMAAAVLTLTFDQLERMEREEKEKS
jgi:hypothetical protein